MSQTKKTFIVTKSSNQSDKQVIKTRALSNNFYFLTKSLCLVNRLIKILQNMS